MATTPKKKSSTAVERSQVDALAAEQEGSGEAVTFDLREETFEVREQLPAIVMLRLSAAADPKTSIAKQMSAIAQFLDNVVKPDDRDRFNAVLEDSEPPVDFDELSNILEEVTEAIATRPTK